MKNICAETKSKENKMTKITIITKSTLIKAFANLLLFCATFPFDKNLEKILNTK